MKKDKAVFLDKDGVINIDQDYDVSIEKLSLIDHTYEAFRLIKSKGYKIVIISNQSGIARGFYSEKENKKQMIFIQEKLQEHGTCYDKYYYCPHYLQGSIEKLKVDCECRKPKPGMLLRASEELGIDLENSYLVGDRVSDLEAGLNAGLKKVFLVKTGKKVTQEANGKATKVYNNLYEFAMELDKIE